MSVHIELSPAEVEILRRNMPDGSDLSQRLAHSESNVIAKKSAKARAALGWGAWIESEARAILRIAVDYCPEAVKNIQYAMNVAGVRFS